MNNDKPLTQGEITRFERYIKDIHQRKLSQLDNTRWTDGNRWKTNKEKELEETFKHGLKELREWVAKINKELKKEGAKLYASSYGDAFNVSLNVDEAWSKESKKIEQLNEEKKEKINKTVQRFREQIIFGNREEIVKALRELEGI